MMGFKWPWESVSDDVSDTAESVTDKISTALSNISDNVASSFSNLGSKISEVIGEGATEILTSIFHNGAVVAVAVVVGVVAIAAAVAVVLDGKNVELRYTSRSNKRGRK